MIIEQEILEQIAEENWPLHRVIAFIGQYKDPWPVVEALYKDKRIEFLDKNQNPIPEWETEQLFRNKTDAIIPEVSVKITADGIERAYD